MSEPKDITERDYQDDAWQDNFFPGDPYDPHARSHHINLDDHPLADTPDPYQDQGMYDGE